MKITPPPPTRKKNKCLKRVRYCSSLGRSMVEMIAVLAIIGVLSIAAVAGIRFAMEKHTANQISKEAFAQGTYLAMKILPPGEVFKNYESSLTNETHRFCANNCVEVHVVNVSESVCEKILASLENPAKILKSVTIGENGATSCAVGANKMVFTFYGNACTATGGGTTVIDPDDPDDPINPPIASNCTNCVGICCQNKCYSFCTGGGMTGFRDDNSCLCSCDTANNFQYSNGQCVCASGYTLSNNTCVPKCTTKTDCTGEQICMNNICVDPQCTTKTDCTGEQICSEGICKFCATADSLNCVENSCAVVDEDSCASECATACPIGTAKVTLANGLCVCMPTICGTNHYGQSGAQYSFVCCSMTYMKDQCGENDDPIGSHVWVGDVFGKGDGVNNYCCCDKNQSEACCKAYNPQWSYINGVCQQCSALKYTYSGHVTTASNTGCCPAATQYQTYNGMCRDLLGSEYIVYCAQETSETECNMPMTNLKTTLCNGGSTTTSSEQECARLGDICGIESQYFSNDRRCLLCGENQYVASDYTCADCNSGRVALSQSECNVNCHGIAVASANHDYLNCYACDSAIFYNETQSSCAALASESGCALKFFPEANASQGACATCNSFLATTSASSFNSCTTNCPGFMVVQRTSSTSYNSAYKECRPCNYFADKYEDGCTSYTGISDYQSCNYFGTDGAWCGRDNWFQQRVSNSSGCGDRYYCKPCSEAEDPCDCVKCGLGTCSSGTCTCNVGAKLENAVCVACETDTTCETCPTETPIWNGSECKAAQPACVEVNTIYTSRGVGCPSTSTPKCLAGAIETCPSVSFLRCCTTGADTCDFDHGTNEGTCQLN